MTYFAVRIGDKPADDEHHYGHGKIESISALAETALLFGLSIMVIWEAAKRLLGEPHIVEASLAAFVVMAISIVVDFFRARALTKTAKKTDSEALEADALHFSSDMWSSGAVILGLGGVALGFSWMDSAAAILVAVLICFAGWRLGKRTIDTLTDVAPSGVAEQLREAIENVDGVLALERIRIRKVGATLFVDIDVGANRALPMDGVAELKERIETAVRKIAKNAELNIAATPRALDDETVLQRVMVIAHNRKLAVHHVTVQAISGRLSVSLDLEVDGALPLGAAHDIASELETAIKNEIGSDIEVETHIEPLQVEDIAGHDAWPERVDIICAALARIAESNSVVRDIHDVRVRETAEGEIVNFHCFAEPARTVARERRQRGTRVAQAVPPNSSRDRPRRATSRIRPHFQISIPARKITQAGITKARQYANRRRPPDPPRRLPRAGLADRDRASRRFARSSKDTRARQARAQAEPGKQDAGASGAGWR